MTEMFTQAFWDKRYGSRRQVWSGEPNPRLVGHASELGAGRALDVGSGEGADAIWLAERGWRVTALDVSPVALGRAAEHAAEAGADVAGRIDWLQKDLLTWEGPEPASYDLVSAQFMHLPKEPRDALFARLAAAVAPGGTLLVVGHHPDDLRATMHRPQIPDMYFTAEEVAGSLDPGQWDILVADARPRPARGSEGQEVTIHDAVLRARRKRP